MLALNLNFLIFGIFACGSGLLCSSSPKFTSETIKDAGNIIIQDDLPLNSGKFV